MESAPVLASKTTSLRGISLVEMIVVIAIISVITTVAIVGQSTFNRTLLLTDTAYTMAFSARQAQSYGLSSRKYGSSTTNPGYGIHFERSTLNRYLMFADTQNTLSPFPAACPTGVAGTPSAKPGNCRFDAADGTVNTYTFANNFSIQKFCAKVTSGTSVCSNDSQPLLNLDLVFTRPNTSTVISGQTTSGTSVNTYNCAVITITDQAGANTRDIRVSSLGEISVGRGLSCP